MRDIESLEKLLAESDRFLLRRRGIETLGIGFFHEGALLLRRQRVAGGFELLIEILQLLAGVSLMLGEVKGATGGNALQLLGAKGEFEENIDAGSCVVGEIRLG